MKKPRKRATTRHTAKAKPARKRSPSPRRAVSSSDDLDVFIPQAPVVSSGVATHADTDDDDVAVFVAAPGPPVMVQSDLVDDIAAGGVTNSQFFDGISDDDAPYGLPPRAMTPGGWTPALLGEHGLLIREKFGRREVVCRYGCNGTTSNVVGVSHHDYTCPYWDREGKTKAPF